MKIISFDVGIKNMAYCILDCSSNISVPNIIDWNIVNLLNNTEDTNMICNQICKNKKKCNSKSKYRESENYYCEKHAKTSKFYIPKKTNSPSYFKKLKKEELIQEMNKYNIELNDNFNKNVLLEKILKYFESNTLIKMNKSKEKATTIDLITIGKNIKKEFYKIDLSEIDVVIIENQISPIASRMKTIQGMLAQYFIMKFDNINIEFLSSSNKLKGFEKINKEDSDYKQHKKDAIYYTKNILEKNDNLKKWNDIFLYEKQNKKDDLADCFLQGIWYFNEKIK